MRDVRVVRRAALACAGIIPLALIRGPLRGIPPHWRFVDMSFGIAGAVPLLAVLRALRPLVERAERSGATGRPPTAVAG
ncbi:hypothetical protein ACFVFS_16140 [Kitasatospora sp. NPDC057692]|uniref:hypothetical protein n=1 Tax=Kitasatospora sp. NPDC057692 TaxID=3346215 RepID=UPI00368757C3